MLRGAWDIRGHWTFNGAALRGGRIVAFAWDCAASGHGLQRSRPPRRADRPRRASPPPSKEPLQRSRPPRRADSCGGIRMCFSITSFNGAALRGGRIASFDRSQRRPSAPFNGAALRGGRIVHPFLCIPSSSKALQRSRPPRRADRASCGGHAQAVA